MVSRSFSCRSCFLPPTLPYHSCIPTNPMFVCSSSPAHPPCIVGLLPQALLCTVAYVLLLLPPVHPPLSAGCHSNRCLLPQLYPEALILLASPSSCPPTYCLCASPAPPAHPQLSACFPSASCPSSVVRLPTQSLLPIRGCPLASPAHPAHPRLSVYFTVVFHMLPPYRFPSVPLSLCVTFPPNQLPHLFCFSLKKRISPGSIIGF